MGKTTVESPLSATPAEHICRHQAASQLAVLQLAQCHLVVGKIFSREPLRVAPASKKKHAPVRFGLNNGVRAGKQSHVALFPHH